MTPYINNVEAYSLRILIAGSLSQAVQTCQKYCDEVGLCVNVSPSTYVFTNGKEDGIIVELINYGRFPSTRPEIWGKAQALAEKLLVDLGQESYTLQDNQFSQWVSYREQDQAK